MRLLQEWERVGVVPLPFQASDQHAPLIPLTIIAPLILLVISLLDITPHYFYENKLWFINLNNLGRSIFFVHSMCLTFKNKLWSVSLTSTYFYTCYKVSRIQTKKWKSFWLTFVRIENVWLIIRSLPDLI